MLSPRDATKEIECRHDVRPLAEDAAHIDVVALHMHDAHCAGSPCTGPNGDDYLRADLMLDDLADYGHEVHRLDVDCTVNPIAQAAVAPAWPGDRAPFWKRLLWAWAQ